MAEIKTLENVSIFNADEKFNALDLDFNPFSSPDFDSDHQFDPYEEENDQMDFVTDLFETLGPEPVSDHPNLESGPGDGLRVVGMDSESDSDELGLDGVGNGEFDWADVWGDLDDEIEVERDEIVSNEVGVDQFEEVEVEVSSELSNEGELLEEIRALEWEILLAISSMERSLESEGYAASADFEYALFGQFLEVDAFDWKGSPPAAKAVVESLPVVVLGGEDCVVCSVCRDEVNADEEVTRLPCRHHFHGECIVPWLRVRNTCPVCRFELPTDDVDYERRNNLVAGADIVRTHLV